MKSAIIVGIVFSLASILLPAESVHSSDDLTIPEQAQCYFSAAAASDSAALAKCFQQKAVIIDVSREISGLDQILIWAEREVFGGRYEVLDIVSKPEKGIKLLIRFIPPGYSGDGFKAHYTFEFEDGKISRMNLQYA